MDLNELVNVISGDATLSGLVAVVAGTEGAVTPNDVAAAVARAITSHGGG